MLRYLWLGLLMWITTFVNGQSFHVITNNDEIAVVDLANCNSTVLAPLPSWVGVISDIAFTPDGTLYGINTSGRLFFFEPTTGAAQQVHIFPNGPNPFYTSLTSDQNGVLYAAGGNGVVRTFNPLTGEQELIGWVDFDGAAGDLTFVNGNLVMAANTNQMVQVNFDDPSQSEAILDFVIAGRIFGIITLVEDCEDPVTIATDNSSNARIYRVNFETGELEYLCSAPHGIYGAANEFEFQAAVTICITDVVPAPSACSAATGSITITATGGSGVLYYSIDGENFQLSPVFDNLAPGTYTIQVRDATGAQYVTSTDVPDASIEILINGIDRENDYCDLMVGSLTIDAEGGSLPLQYSIDGINYQTNPSFEGLSSGSYSIYIQDADGCVAESIASINNIAGPQIQAVEVTACGGQNNSVGIFAAGNGPFLYSLDGGQTFQNTPLFSAVDPGDYAITVEDINGCTVTAETSIPEIAPLLFTEVTTQNCGVQASSITAQAMGGIAPLTYQLNDEAQQTDGVFAGLSPGNYGLRVIDATGCYMDTTLQLADYRPPTLDAIDITPARCATLTGSVQLTTSGDGAPFSYQLNNASPQVEDRFEDLPAGIFTLAITDQSGCMLRDSLFVPSDCPVYIPNAFSPNGDGFNDRFEIFSGQPFQIMLFQVYDRWGGMVYEQTDFSSDEANRFWNGEQNGKPLNTGVFTYHIEWVNAQGQSEREMGDVMLLR
jgi:gliding motility-associated-like protein